MSADENDVPTPDGPVEDTTMPDMPRKRTPSPRVSRPCFEGKHVECGRQVLLPRPDSEGRIYAPCECVVCRHVPDYRRVR